MKTTNTTLGILAVMIIAYFALKYVIPYGNFIIYPINLLVTFMHEFGHAFFSLITGGSVDELQVNSDGSGVTTTRGGWRIFVLMGGYLGSALFGNILLYYGLVKKTPKQENIPEMILYGLAGIMIVTSIIWFSGVISFIILWTIAGALILIAKKTDYDTIVLQFLGVACLLFIIEDFNVGPTSDLSKFSEIFIFIPQVVWMLAWLIAVVAMTVYNLRLIYKK